MAYKCDNCDKGKNYGHMVSHAKNRLRRIFKPNLQKLKVLQSGIVVRVKFCTNCIKRLNKDGAIGMYSKIKLQTAAAFTAPIKTIMKETAVKAVKEKKVKAQKVRETIDISAIVGLPAGKAGKKD